MIQRYLGWEPRTRLRDGMAKTYAWIETEYQKVLASPALDGDAPTGRHAVAAT
jgi:dTDP-D-glucose 4,6-dehydratase